MQTTKCFLEESLKNKLWVAKKLCSNSSNAREPRTLYTVVARVLFGFEMWKFNFPKIAYMFCNSIARIFDSRSILRRMEP